MREGLGVLATVVLLAIVGFGCSGGEDGAAGTGTERKADRAAASPVQNDLGHQACEPATRLVVPSAAGMPLDRAARVLAGLSEGPLGTRPLVARRPGRGGRRPWRAGGGD